MLVAAHRIKCAPYHHILLTLSKTEQTHFWRKSSQHSLAPSTRRENSRGQRSTQTNNEWKSQVVVVMIAAAKVSFNMRVPQCVFVFTSVWCTSHENAFLLSTRAPKSSSTHAKNLRELIAKGYACVCVWVRQYISSVGCFLYVVYKILLILLLLYAIHYRWISRRESIARNRRVFSGL